MKRFMITGMLLATGIIFSQHINPKLEAYGQLVKATYFHENGKIRQEGFFKDGKLEGQWVSYDENGIKTAMAEYARGEKTGKWIFLGETMLSEVDYRNSRIMNIKNWKQEALVNRN